VLLRKGITTDTHTQAPLAATSGACASVEDAPSCSPRAESDPTHWPSPETTPARACPRAVRPPTAKHHMHHTQLHIHSIRGRPGVLCTRTSSVHSAAARAPTKRSASVVAGTGHRHQRGRHKHGSAYRRLTLRCTAEAGARAVHCTHPAGGLRNQAQRSARTHCLGPACACLRHQDASPTPPRQGLRPPHLAPRHASSSAGDSTLLGTGHTWCSQRGSGD
jgi:hypothetical protein